jgi:protein O-GlcNAc transferase
MTNTANQHPHDAHEKGAPSMNDQIDIALKHQKSGETTEALRMYSDILASGQRSPRLFNNMGVLLYQIGQRKEALDLFEKALAIDIGYSETWSNLEVDAQDVSGLILIQLARRLKDANPSNTDCICAEAIGLMHSGQEKEAASIFRDVLISDPNSITARERLAKCLIALGDYDAATSEIMYLLSIDPSNKIANLEAARLALRLGDTNSAISILNSLIESGSDDVLIRNELGLIYHNKGDLEAAIRMYSEILCDHPNCYEIKANLGSCFHELGLTEKALEHYKDCVHVSSSPSAIHPAIFFCSAMGINYIDRLKEWSQIYWNLIGAKPSLSQSDQHSHSQQELIKHNNFSISSIKSKKRVGIVTGDLGMHAVSYFLSSFLMNYDKSRLHVEIISTKYRMDEAAKFLSEYPDNIVSIGSLPDEVATERIRSRELDVIIETSGFTSGSALHLLANRCAPSQLHWIGYHASTHMPSMDYFIGDEVITPSSHESHFSEQIIRLNRAWVAGTPFYPIPEATCNSSDEVIIGAFSQIQKITDETLELWGSVLQQYPHVKLLIKDRLVSNTGSRNRIFSRLNDFHVDANRIILHEQRQSWHEHMLMYNLLDLALDTTPWSAATTAFDALSMGVPLISLRGKTLSGLQSTSALWHLGRHEWIADSKDDYIKKCCHIIENIHIFRREKTMLQSEALKSQLFNQKSLCLAIENVLLNQLP